LAGLIFDLGFSLNAITSRMTLCATWTASPLRFFAGFLMPTACHSREQSGSQWIFNVAHYLILDVLTSLPARYRIGNRLRPPNGLFLTTSPLHHPWHAAFLLTLRRPQRPTQNIAKPIPPNTTLPGSGAAVMIKSGSRLPPAMRELNR
jgi:hypothetical protein